ncbi:MAG: FkbM family methyltransferase [Betaproteobacteria bacterium]|nr:MAG: FkbM family methyltransferase [Betaproteobacteria bacterium]
MRIKKIIHKVLQSAGYEIVYYRPAHHPLARTKWLLDLYDVSVVLDVGANTGQFSERLREAGYQQQIISFEPLPDAFAVIKEKAINDRWGWEVNNFALGSREERTMIHIAGNSYSSSILPMLSTHEQSRPESRYVGEVEIKVKTLDSVFLSRWRSGQRVFLKIDTQGFEKQVLDGAAESLPFIDTIQIEMSMTPLYEGGLLFEEMYSFVKSLGYRLVAIEPGFFDTETGEMFQVDGIFHRFA